MQHNKNQLTRTDKMSEWISVRDRLPDNGMSVLVAGYAYNMPSRGYWILTLHRDWDKWLISDDDDKEWQGHPPTHWMPLPEPPSE